MDNKLTSEQINDTYVVVSITHAGKKWEVRVTADLDKDGGLLVDITRDDILCVETGFDWCERHQNERQEVTPEEQEAYEREFERQEDANAG